MKPFESTIQVRWSDVDQNRHVRHSAYYDYGAFARIQYITQAGYDTRELEALHIGPILFEEKCNFIREIKPEDIVRISVLKGEMTSDGSFWTLHHELHNQHDKKVAHITVKGAWMDILKRKLTAPPEKLAKAFANLEQGQKYERK
jgi:acyl-CoA thioester hydrolase